MKTIQPLLDLMTARAGDAARIRDWRFCWTTRESAKVGVKDGSRAGVHAPLTLGNGFALDYLFHWDEGRISSGAAEKIALTDPERFLHLAHQGAFEDPDGANFAGPTEFSKTPIYSEVLAETARAGAVSLFAPLIDAAQERGSAWSFKTWSGSVSATVSAAGVLTSRGLSAETRSTISSYSFWYEGRTGDGHASREPIPVPEAAGRIERSCDLVKRLGEPHPSFAPGTMPVLLHPDVVESLLSHYVLSSLHGERLFHRQGAFPIEQFSSKERTFAPFVSLRLEPCLPMSTGSFLFTTEGVPARPVDYIAGGCLVSPILDLKYARRLKRPPAPGPASAESLRLTGTAPMAQEQALRTIRRGALVLSLLGLHTQDATSGDFSVSAPQTLAIEGGALGGAVKAVLTGNFFHVLRDPALGFVAFEGFTMPGLLFEATVGVDGAG